MFEVSSKDGNKNETVVPLTDDLRALFIGANTNKDIINTFDHLTPLKSTPITVRIELHSGNIRPDEVHNIKYAKEGIPIFEAYPYFKDWVQGNLENTEEWSSAPSFDKIYLPE